MIDETVVLPVADLGLGVKDTRLSCDRYLNHEHVF